MKKVLFCLSLLFLLTGCGSDVEVSKKEGETQASTPQPTEEIAQERFYIGDVIEISTSSGDYTITITAINETKERNSYSDKKADRVVVIDYSVENTNSESDISVFDYNFKAYDAENNAMETYPILMPSVSSIGLGRKGSGQMAYALNSDTNKIELEYYDNMFNSKKDCLIELTW